MAASLCLCWAQKLNWPQTQTGSLAHRGGFFLKKRKRNNNNNKRKNWQHHHLDTLWECLFWKKNKTRENKTANLGLFWFSVHCDNKPHKYTLVLQSAIPPFKPTVCVDVLLPSTINSIQHGKILVRTTDPG